MRYLVDNQGNFTVDSHSTNSADGYILKMFRLYPSFMDKSLMNKRPAVLLMHDYLSSSEDFVNNGNNSLGFLLALDGYDVWMGNNRGNRFSQ